MRVFISADLEGVNGVVSYDHVEPDKPLYRQAQEWMITEVAAAIRGCLAAGASEVVVNDAHHRGINLPLDRLPAPARLVTGHDRPFSMMEGIDASYEAALFIGYHARAGTPQAVHDHTFSASTFHDVRINGMSVGEFGLNAALAGWFGVPAVLVTGDQACCQEAKALLPAVECVAVKMAFSRYSALCLPFETSLREIEQAAARAVARRKEIPPLRFSPPFTLECTFQRAEQAERACRVGRGRRIGPFSIAYESDDYADLYKAFLAIYRGSM
ncbi:MAG: M55 family metallopeptidase [candidate division KSB1 bacterium]|nr:M55 family metallopeptidase [candidate division KSB1 bacterium]